MHIIRETEKDTQKRVIEFFQDALNYTYLGNWADSADENSNIIPEDLADWLRKQNDPNITNKAVYQLQQAAKIGGSRTLYEANFEVYELLRYGVKVQPDVSEQHKTVWLIDWKNPENNDFGIAEEVALRGKNNKRPDLVLYINGIAIGVLELKRSIVSISEGIRQNLANQTGTFIEWFFSTVQLVMAGNETEGLRYGVIKTPEKYWLRWKEKHAQPRTENNPLLRELSQFCNKRTQSGKLHKAMKELLPNAMLIGFTGTPLLKNDKQRSIETFGKFIDTYKYDEAVQDEVVLDLQYEARDIDQNLTSQDRIDQFFDSKTRGLNDVAKAQLKERWGTMLNVESSMNRLRKIVADIVLDMGTRDRLKSGTGNAMLVANSILSACRLYNLFQDTPLRGKCAVVTSYRPTTESIRLEETGEGLTENQQKYNTYREMLAAHFDEPPDTAMHKVDRFEQEVQKRFIEEPALMKLLIVVDKLLTGFDAPPATYLYIDKSMQDHGLFQAICRVNRIDRDDKEFGYIVDYKDLFGSLKQAMTDYTGEAFENYDTEDSDEAIEKLPEGIRTNPEVLAATIENNIRRVIVDKSEINPKYYEDMAQLLDELIRQRRQEAINYRQYLSEVTKVSKRVTDSTAGSNYPPNIDTRPRQAFFDNLSDDTPVDRRTAIARAIDEAIIDARSDEWRGNGFKELEIRNAIETVTLDDFDDDTIDVDKIFNIAKSQDEY